MRPTACATVDVFETKIRLSPSSFSIAPDEQCPRLSQAGVCRRQSSELAGGVVYLKYGQCMGCTIWRGVGVAFSTSCWRSFFARADLESNPQRESF